MCKLTKNMEEVINMDNKNMTLEHKSLNVIKSKLKMESKVTVASDGDVLLKVHLADNYYAFVRDDSDFEKGKPFNISLVYGEIGINNISTNKLEDAILVIKDMSKIAEGLILLGYDELYDVKNLRNEVTNMIERRIAIHNYLVDYIFKIGNNEAKQKLMNLGINADDYVMKGKSFRNRHTKKFVTIF